MAWSLESRVPFLNRDLVEYVLALPEPYIISPNAVTKHVFREAMRGIVPDGILERRDKVGFATPEKKWLTELGPWVAGVLSPERLERVPALDAAAVGREAVKLAAALAAGRDPSKSGAPVQDAKYVRIRYKALTR